MYKNFKVVDMAHMLSDYPQKNARLFKGRDYQVCTKLEIGYFVLFSGRLFYLPSELKNYDYTIYQKPVDI